VARVKLAEIALSRYTLGFELVGDDLLFWTNKRSLGPCSRLAALLGGSGDTEVSLTLV
jgi:hypothetical protein